MAQPFRPSGPYNVPLRLMVPANVMIKGVPKKNYADDDVFYCSFKSFGGTENIVNGVLSIIDTANVETWYNPEIKADCRVKTETGDTYEIMNTPEDIEMRHQVMRFKVKRVVGGN